jgi:hypothetical protein
MSHRDSLSKLIDNEIHAFIKHISQSYKLNPDELLAIWEGDTTKKISKPLVVVDPNVSRSAAELMEMKATELKELCRHLGKKLSGTKSELIERITGEEVVDIPKKNKQSTSTSTKEKVPLIKKLMEASSKKVLIQDINGNYTDKDTGFVFDKNTQKVTGKVEGTVIVPINEKDIETCQKLNYLYEIPENLDTDSNIEKEDDELEEEELNDEDIIEESDDDEEYEYECE